MSDELLPGVGIPKLVEHLSALINGHSVAIAYAPPPAGEHIRWRVYDKHSDGYRGTLGEGTTIYRALQQAYENVVEWTFKGETL